MSNHHWSSDNEISNPAFLHEHHTSFQTRHKARRRSHLGYAGMLGKNRGRGEIEVNVLSERDHRTDHELARKDFPDYRLGQRV